MFLHMCFFHGSVCVDPYEVYLLGSRVPGNKSTNSKRLANSWDEILSTAHSGIAIFVFTYLVAYPYSHGYSLHMILYEFDSAAMFTD